MTRAQHSALHHIAPDVKARVDAIGQRHTLKRRHQLTRPSCFRIWPSSRRDNPSQQKYAGVQVGTRSIVAPLICPSLHQPHTLCTAIPCNLTHHTSHITRNLTHHTSHITRNLTSHLNHKCRRSIRNGPSLVHHLQRNERQHHTAHAAVHVTCRALVVAHSRFGKTVRSKGVKGLAMVAATTYML
jgi:hypothetical protein